MVSFTSDQRFIVTGAASGIGKCVALLLNKCGAGVIAVDRNADAFDEMKNCAEHPENLFFEQKDLTQDVGQLPAWIKSLKDQYGKFQGLAFCAGIGQVKPVRALEEDEVRRTFEINFFAPYMTAKAFTDKRNHNGAGTSCVFIASVAALRCDKGQSAYAGSKGALVSAIRCIAKEVATQGVRFNCVSPSAVKTPLLQLTDSEALAEQEKLYPMGMADAADVADMIVYLLSDKTKWITAQNYVIDCGAML